MRGHAAPYPRGALATPHYLASAAGAAVFARGGNAIDAIIGANLALGVVAPYLCGYGGDIFAIVWDGELHGYLGSGSLTGGGHHRCRARRARGDSTPDRSALGDGARCRSPVGSSSSNVGER